MRKRSIAMIIIVGIIVGMGGYVLISEMSTSTLPWGETPVIESIVPLNATGGNENISSIQQFGYVFADFYHEGNDYALVSGLTFQEFIAPYACYIENVRLYHDEHNPYWNVEINAKLNRFWRIYFNFEPFSSDQSDGEIQLGMITVHPGERVEQGQSLGRLHKVGVDGHVHFSISQNNTVRCPFEFHSTTAKNFISTKVAKPCVYTWPP